MIINKKMSKKEEIIDVPDINKILKVTEKARDKFNSNLEEAIDMAFNMITKEVGTKIRQDATQGKTRTYLYEWEYDSNPNSNKYKFNNIRIGYLVKKTNLIDRLNKYFKKGSDIYKVGWHKFKTGKFGSSNISRYGIYVSWYVKDKEDE